MALYHLNESDDNADGADDGDILADQHFEFVKTTVRVNDFRHLEDETRGHHFTRVWFEFRKHVIWEGGLNTWVEIITIVGFMWRIPSPQPVISERQQESGTSVPKRK